MLLKKVTINQGQVRETHTHKLFLVIDKQSCLFDFHNSKQIRMFVFIVAKNYPAKNHWTNKLIKNKIAKQIWYLEKKETEFFKWNLHLIGCLPEWRLFDDDSRDVSEIGKKCSTRFDWLIYNAPLKCLAVIGRRVLTLKVNKQIYFDC